MGGLGSMGEWEDLEDSAEGKDMILSLTLLKQSDT